MSAMNEPLELEPCQFRRRPEETQHLVDDEPARRRLVSRNGAVAAVPPFTRVPAEGRSERIPRDVQERTDEMRLTQHLYPPETISEEVIRPIVATVRAPGVVAVQLPKSR
jgi:hypothetical protein